MVRWGLIAGACTTAVCIPLALLDGGISAFASFSAFQASFGAGTLVFGEIVAANAAGKAVGAVVDGIVEGKGKKVRSGLKEVRKEGKDALKEQCEEGNVDALLEKVAELAADTCAGIPVLPELLSAFL